MQTSSSQVKLLRAGELAKSGDFEAALVLLLQMEPTPASLDLRARIEVQRGRYSDAGELWDEVLELAPNHEGAKRGLRSVERAAVRGKLLAAGALLLALLGVGWIAVRAMRGTPAQPATAHLQLPAAQPKPVAAPAKPIPPAPAAVAVAAAPRLPTLDLPQGVQVREEAGAQIYSFDNGLFDLGFGFVPGGKERVTALGRALAPHSATLHIELIGYVDSLPTDKAYHDTNTGLALARANAVLGRLARTTKLPADAIGLRAVGGSLGPYSNEPGNPNNRTVDVRVSLRTQR
ncbi:MAG TPA: hypothetical protein VJR89_21785 [Polyangiales bacterium]|nr:hypothetical protein [Polyangiales bacterium]